MTQTPTPGPRNPVEAKTCIFTLSRGGLLRLLYEQRDGSWPEVSTELEPSPLQVDTSFTHASFTCIKGKNLPMYSLHSKANLCRRKLGSSYL